MLILTRRIRETLCIGDNVQVTVLGVKGDQVRIGIEAPKEIPVHRKEIWDKIRKEKEEALMRVPPISEEPVEGVDDTRLLRDEDVMARDGH